MATKMIVRCNEASRDRRDILRSINSLFSNNNIRISVDNDNIYICGKDIEQYYKQVSDIIRNVKMKVHDMGLRNIMFMEALIEEKRINPEKSFWNTDECFYDGTSKRNFLVYINNKYTKMKTLNKPLNEYDKTMVKLLEEFRNAGNIYLTDKNNLALLRNLMQVEKKIINAESITEDDRKLIHNAYTIRRNGNKDSWVIKKISEVISSIESNRKKDDDILNYERMKEILQSMEEKNVYDVSSLNGHFTSGPSYLYEWSKIASRACKYYKEQKSNVTTLEVFMFQVMAYIENVKYVKEKARMESIYNSYFENGVISDKNFVVCINERLKSYYASNLGISVDNLEIAHMMALIDKDIMIKENKRVESIYLSNGNISSDDYYFLLQMGWKAHKYYLNNMSVSKEELDMFHMLALMENKTISLSQSNNLIR